MQLQSTSIPVKEKPRASSRAGQTPAMTPYAIARPMKENFCQWGSSSILRHQGGRSSGWMPNVCRGSQPVSQCASLIAGKPPGLHQAVGL